jgi:hypothetical protein
LIKDLSKIIPLNNINFTCNWKRDEFGAVVTIEATQENFWW